MGGLPRTPRTGLPAAWCLDSSAWEPTAVPLRGSAGTPGLARHLHGALCEFKIQFKGSHLEGVPGCVFWVGGLEFTASFKPVL